MSVEVEYRLQFWGYGNWLDFKRPNLDGCKNATEAKAVAGNIVNQMRRDGRPVVPRRIIKRTIKTTDRVVAKVEKEG